MIGLILAMHGDKMGVGHAQFRRLVVHKLGKSGGGTGNMLGNGNSGIIAGGEHQTVKQILQRPLFALLQSHKGIVFGKIHRAGADGHHIFQISLLQRDQAGEDLDGAPGGAALIGILFQSVQSRSGIGSIYQDHIPLPESTHVKTVGSGSRNGKQQGDAKKKR